MFNYWFISPRYRQHGRLALFTFLLAFVVILLGAYTRLTDAGLSCPDWPHCYGYMTAPHTDDQIRTAAQNYPLAPIDVKKAWTEMTHRYFAGTEGILILVLAFSILFARKAKNFKSAGIALGLIGLLVIQVMLGMLTVTEKLKPVIVLSHLLTGLSLLTLLWWAYLDLYLGNDTLFLQEKPRRLTPWIGAGFIILALQITLGGWVSTHYAGLACVDFPYCNGQLLPAMQWDQLNTDLITIHMLHRLGAMITGLYLGLLGMYLVSVKAFRIMGVTILLLVTLQITLGIFNIIWLRPVWIALIHQAVAILLLLTIVAAWVKASLNKGKPHDRRIS